MSRSVILGLSLGVVLTWASTASAQIDVRLDPQSQGATDRITRARTDLEQGCATRAGLPGFPNIIVDNAGTPVHEFKDKTEVPAQYGPDQIPNSACGATPGNRSFVLLFQRARSGGSWFNCPEDDTTLHEIVAHLLEVGHTFNFTGITRVPTITNGVPMDREINDWECGEVDKAGGKPNYDDNGDEIGPQNPYPGSPILLDIGGRGGIWTTGVDDPVLFDIDSEGFERTMTWSAPGRGQAFLVLDLSGNGAIDDGSELFGTGTFLEDEGVQAEHGFAALAQYDSPARGGNGDGVIDANDAVWSRLRLWSDVNHSATSRQPEIRTLDRHDVVGLELDFVETDNHDAEGNWHRFRGFFHKRTKIRGRWTVTRELMEDVFFQIIK